MQFVIPLSALSTATSMMEACRSMAASVDRDHLHREPLLEPAQGLEARAYPVSADVDVPAEVLEIGLALEELGRHLEGERHLAKELDPGALLAAPRGRAEVRDDGRILRGVGQHDAEVGHVGLVLQTGLAGQQVDEAPGGQEPIELEELSERLRTVHSAGVVLELAHPDVVGLVGGERERRVHQEGRAGLLGDRYERGRGRHAKYPSASPSLDGREFYTADAKSSIALVKNFPRHDPAQNLRV
jgi:hypothetical protein